MSASDALRIAAAEVGTTESPPGSNRVGYWSVLPEFQGGSWCGAFVWWVLAKVHATPDWTTVRRFVYTPAGIADARAHGAFYTSRPAAGDVVWFNFDADPGPEHVAFVRSAAAWDAGFVDTIEGNTSLTGSQSNGGEVMARRRPRSLIIGFGRIDYTPKPAVTSPMGEAVDLYETPDGRVWDIGASGKRYVTHPDTVAAYAGKGGKVQPITAKGADAVPTIPAWLRSPTPPAATVDVAALAAAIAPHLPSSVDPAAVAHQVLLELRTGLPAT